MSPTKFRPVENGLLIRLAITICENGALAADKFTFELWYPDPESNGLTETNILLPLEAQVQIAQIQTLLHCAEGDGDGQFSDPDLLRLRFGFDRKRVTDEDMMRICTQGFQSAEYHRLANLCLALIYQLVCDHLKRFQTERQWDIRAQGHVFLMDRKGKLILMTTPFFS